MTNRFDTKGFELTPWQKEAVSAWSAGPTRDRPFFGTLEVVTGGGKTLMALACAAAAAEATHDLRLAIVVPSEALAHQWRTALERYTTLTPDEIGLLGAGESGDFDRHRALVAVINTAARRLPEMAQAAQPLMLIVDECHRAGAPTYSRVLQTPATFRLGLSATPDRDEIDESGEPLQYDEQVVGRLLGPVVFQFSLRDARLAGWLPDFELHHHGVPLLPEEQRRYDAISRQVDDAADALRAVGLDTSRAQQLQSRQDESGELARRYLALTANRKDLLYRASQRAGVVERILAQTLDRPDGARRALLFHERVTEAAELYDRLRHALPAIPMALEHSRLTDTRRAEALGAFRTGLVQVLVSVKSLVEGIDVPDADIGISVAATASVRQRIQALGRVLRRGSANGNERKRAEMHLLYVTGTVDERIYGKEDWTDLTGPDANFYWKWSLDTAASPERLLGPPTSPKPTEEQEWIRLREQAPTEPVPWSGVLTGQEYSVDTVGTVTNISGAVIGNPQGAAEAVEKVRRRPGGRFWVTPSHRLLLVYGRDEAGESVPFVAGQIAEPFVALEPGPTDESTAAATEPGDLLLGQPDKEGGTYRLRQKQGGVIERRAADGGVEFASTTGENRRADNARRLLGAWRKVTDRGITFFLDRDGVAWYLEAGSPRFLAHVRDGFFWPSAEEGS
ncbi:MAG TPA: DEAD/DEAH box helicase [Blastococcus sp.]|nr:DEAD/DEAH box helicase [Blastococcus sp.]